MSEEPLLHQRTISLTAKQFTTLLQTLTHNLTWVKPTEKPHKLTLISYQQNITQEAPARFFEVSQPTISRTISTIEKAPTPLA